MLADVFRFPFKPCDSYVSVVSHTLIFTSNFSMVLSYTMKIIFPFLAADAIQIYIREFPKMGSMSVNIISAYYERYFLESYFNF
jgi:hypothetical protein